VKPLRLKGDMLSKKFLKFTYLYHLEQFSVDIHVLHVMYILYQADSTADMPRI